MSKLTINESAPMQVCYTCGCETPVGQEMRHFYGCQVAQQPEAQAGAFRHKWDDAGERCTLCGDKDWMETKCSGPRTEPHQPEPKEDA